MKLKYRKFAFIGLIFFAIPTLAFASGLDDIIENGESVNDDLLLWENTTVEEGAVINGDVTVFGGDFDFAGTINGDLTIFGGDAEIDGKVAGNIAVFAGDLELTSTAVINGECALVGGDIDVDEGVHNCFNPITAELSLDSFRNVATLGGFAANASDTSVIVPNESGSVLSAASSLIFMSLVIGGIAFFVTSAVPNRLYEVRSAVRNNPGAAGGIGFLTTIAGSSFIILSSFIWVPILAVLTLVCGLGIFLGFAG
ncbi:MAG: polymer-forming cytoskeletal protein, partial [Chloroflexota bacterium]